MEGPDVPAKIQDVLALMGTNGTLRAATFKEGITNPDFPSALKAQARMEQLVQKHVASASDLPPLTTRHLQTLIGLLQPTTRKSLVQEALGQRDPRKQSDALLALGAGMKHLSDDQRKEVFDAAMTLGGESGRKAMQGLARGFPHLSGDQQGALLARAERYHQAAELDGIFPTIASHFPALSLERQTQLHELADRLRTQSPAAYNALLAALSKHLPSIGSTRTAEVFAALGNNATDTACREELFGHLVQQAGLLTQRQQTALLDHALSLPVAGPHAGVGPRAEALALLGRHYDVLQPRIRNALVRAITDPNVTPPGQIHHAISGLGSQFDKVPSSVQGDLRRLAQTDPTQPAPIGHAQLLESLGHSFKALPVNTCDTVFEEALNCRANDRYRALGGVVRAAQWLSMDQREALVDAVEGLQSDDHIAHIASEHLSASAQFFTPEQRTRLYTKLGQIAPAAQLATAIEMASNRPSALYKQG